MLRNAPIIILLFKRRKQNICTILSKLLSFSLFSLYPRKRSIGQKGSNANKIIHTVLFHHCYYISSGYALKDDRSNGHDGTDIYGDIINSTQVNLLMYIFCIS